MSLNLEFKEKISSLVKAIMEDVASFFGLGIKKIGCNKIEKLEANDYVARILKKYDFI